MTGRKLLLLFVFATQATAADTRPVLSLSYEGRWDGKRELVVQKGPSDGKTYQIALVAGLEPRSLRPLSADVVNGILAQSTDDLAALTKRPAKGAQCQNAAFEFHLDHQAGKGSFCTSHDADSSAVGAAERVFNRFREALGD